MNYCQVNHKQHDRKNVKTVLGDFQIYDFEKYMGFKGYCTGQDDVSRTIGMAGQWSMEVYKKIHEILSKAKKGSLFMDVGCHIGWFSRLADSLGAQVAGIDGDPENIEVAKVNVPNGKFMSSWFGEDTLPSELSPDIELMKIDIEGNEQWAVQYFEKSFEAGKVKNAIMEISPVFNKSYPDLVRKLEAWGYKAFLLDGSPWDGQWDFEQTDFHFRKA